MPEDAEFKSKLLESGDFDAGDSRLRAADLQVRLGLSRANVYRLMQSHILPTVRIGGSIRVPKRALARWIEENTQPGRQILARTRDTY